MLPGTVLFGLVALGVAQCAAQPTASSASALSREMTVHETDDAGVPTLNSTVLANPVSTFEVPTDLVTPGIYAASHTIKARSRARSADTTITTAVCLQTHYKPTDSDCKALCANFNATNNPKSLTLQPGHVTTFELGNCAYSVKNLETCKNVTFSPYTWLGALCQSMESNCAAKGYDAYVQYASPQAGMVLSADQAAPPWGARACN